MDCLHSLFLRALVLYHCVDRIPQLAHVAVQPEKAQGEEGTQGMVSPARYLTEDSDG